MEQSITVISNRISSWDWQIFFQSARNLGNQFNDRTWRFLKAEVLAIALVVASRGESEYVDEKGYDLILDDVKIEVKTQETAFTTKLDTASIRMKNTMGENQTFEKTFDYLLIANSEPPYLAALAPWKEVYSGHKMTKDAVVTKIPKSGLVFLTSETGEVLEKKLPPSDSLKEYIRNGVRDWINQIDSNIKSTEDF